jgi:hypothetical protein
MKTRFLLGALFLSIMLILSTSRAVLAGESLGCGSGPQDFLYDQIECEERHCSCGFRWDTTGFCTFDFTDCESVPLGECECSDYLYVPEGSLCSEIGNSCVTQWNICNSGTPGYGTQCYTTSGGVPLNGSPGVGMCAYGIKLCNFQGNYLYCSGAIGPGQYPLETSCGDGVDNNCNGQLDCADIPSCGSSPLCQQCNSFDSGHNYFEIRNVSNGVILRVDQAGTMWIRGTVKSLTLTYDTHDFLIQNSSGAVRAWVDASNGDLYLPGGAAGVNVVAQGLNPTSSGNFVIQNNTGANKLWINSSGLYVKGCLGTGKTNMV